MSEGHPSILLPDEPIGSLDEYLERGGLDGLTRALTMSPDEVIGEVSRSGLRGRGGAGFPTGTKWRSVAGDPTTPRFFVANGAEGEPGTFKDRRLMRDDPYAVIEGIAIGAYAVGAEHAYIGLKASFEPELAAIRRAIDEMTAAGVLGTFPIDVVEGPDEYLFGEETGLLEVIQGNLPLPRILAPYQQGLFFSTQSHNPTAANNVETLANVPRIISRGAEWFRGYGTDSSPGTMIFTLTGDVQAPGVYELPLGLPMRELVETIGGSVPEGRALKAIFPGASAGVLTPEQLDTPLDFDGMKRAGSGLGSAGFIVFDDSVCIVRAAMTYSRFLYVESCAQCPPCKHGSGEITMYLARIERGEGTEGDYATALARCDTVTDGRRCALPVGEAALMRSLLVAYEDEFRAHLGRRCPSARDVQVAKLVDFDEQAHGFVYDERYRLKQPDWSYAQG